MPISEKVKKLLLLYNTLKYLKYSQIYFRIRRFLITPRVDAVLGDFKPQPNPLFKNIILYEEKIDSSLNASFLNHTKVLQLPKDWNNETQSKLWTYNLHYFETLLSCIFKNKQNLHLNLLDRWIEDNPEGKGNGWEPYTISLRICNVLKAWQAGLQMKTRHFESLFAQASYLSNSVEKHLLGNHYFVNLKALLYAGIIFEKKEWISKAKKGLTEEIQEQVLEDSAGVSHIIL